MIVGGDVKAAKPVLKALTMADLCRLSFPSLISFKTKLPYSSASFQPNRSCCPFAPSIVLPSFVMCSKARFSSIHTFVGQTSDWAQQQQETEGEGYTDDEQGVLLDDDDDFGEILEGVSEEDDDAAEPVEVSEEDDEAEAADDGDYTEPSDEAKLFVGNLPYDLDSPQLAELFSQAGTVEIAEIIFNRETDRSRGFGFVTMSTVEEAEKAMEKFHRFEIRGRLLNVNKAAPGGTKPERGWKKSSFRVFVGNLPWDVDHARLEQIFSEHGKVLNAKVIYNRGTGRSRGFGFVDFATESEMNDAISALDGQSLDGRVIGVSVAEQRPRRTASF